jgi:hypothetical protein
MKQHPENKKRARWALAALETFHGETRADLPEDALKDLICDLGHYADSQGLDFPDVVTKAVATWKIEQTDPLGIQDPPHVDIHIHDT